MSSQNTPNEIQVTLIELNLRKEKWMSMRISNYYSSIYDNYIILEDFNMERNCPAFRQSFNLLNSIKTNTCFKGGNDSCIDLILTNRKLRFKHCSTFETGLSDYHHLVYFMLKTCKREESKHFIYCVYQNFNDRNLWVGLENKLAECPKHCENSEKTFGNVLDVHAIRKTEPFRGNHKPHFDKNIRKVFIKQS